MNDTETFAEEVRVRRKAAGLSQIELAAVAGVSLDTIQSIESSRRDVKTKTAELVCAALREAEAPGDVEGVFGCLVKAARVHAFLRQEDLAALMAESGVVLHPSAVAKIEAGRRAVRLREAVAIAAALRVPLADLLTPPAEGVVTDWQRGYQACSNRVLRALTEGDQCPRC